LEESKEGRPRKYRKRDRGEKKERMKERVKNKK
jgi:hypothetical protein